ncbi:hypothetical protein PR048_033414 [Dryococelus australis]|uniref:Uncharacterized protein n=1 Tax=Dryococelus australis TaxID=614101 RepID=A0ABQ9G4D6_9NEOP|nr:hypothetical protein PR048_033414 [Dryococelus australis]
MPVATVRTIPRERSRLYAAYEVQFVKAIKPGDKIKRTEFATGMMRRFEENEEFFKRIMFSGEACFHVSGTLNRHLGIQDPRFHHESKTSPRKLMCRVIGPFCSAEQTFTAAIYLDMWTWWKTMDVFSRLN